MCPTKAWHNYRLMLSCR